MPSNPFDNLPRQDQANTTNPFHDSSRATVEPEPGTKKKKGKNGKGKAKSAAQTAQEEIIQFSPPKEAEPAPQPEPEPEAEPEPDPEPSSYPETEPNLPPPAPIVSPVLEALGSLGANADNETAFRTGAWAKSIPIGKSPPSLLDAIPDAGFSSGSPFSLPNHPERMGGFSQVSSSTSPPPAHARPMSYGNGYGSIPSSRHQSGDRQTRHSIGAQLHNQPPLPHLPQPHFYGAPEVDIPSLSPRLGPTTEKHYSFCAFDTIGWYSSKATRMGGKVLVVGTDGALEVLMIEDRKTRPIGKLEGLNGRVVNAKLIPQSSQPDVSVGPRPHVAIVIHGPIGLREEGPGTPSAGSESNEVFSGLSGRPRLQETRQQPRDEATHYQTRVEIYSLKTGELVSTLFKSNPVPGFDKFPNLNRFAPSPQGQLKILVSERYIIVVSDVTGEVYVYGTISSIATVPYPCLAKTWTSVQSRETRRYSNSSSSTDQDGSQLEPSNGSHSFDMALISLSGRWLAVVPPSSSARAPPLGAVPSSLIHRKIHGLETHIPPAKPSVNCATDSGEGESLLDRVARGVTQEVLKGARWMGDQGLQAWNHYWNKDQQSATNTAARRASPYIEQAQHGQASAAFPPTHAQDTLGVPSASDSDTVALLDLRKLEENPQETRLSFPNPIATFQVPNGCSFLSFSPNGLMLLTASKKGDVQYVWDLMQMKHCRALEFMSEEPSSNAPLIPVNPLVRLISRYTRLTTSSIVDIVWTEPTGERLAILTRKGTVHTFDLARTAFQWPPLRRVRPKSRQLAPDDSAVAAQSEESSSGNPFSAAMKLVGGTTQPILAAVRNRAPSAGQAFSGVTGFGISSVAGARGGKVVAAGLSKSMGAATGTVNNLRHVGENRLHLAGFSRDPVASRVTWISTKDECLLAVVDGGYFRIFKVNRSTSGDKSRRGGQPVIGGKIMELTLPPHLHNPSGPLHLAPVVDTSPSALWALPSAAVHPSTVSKLQSQPLSQAEIETNAPYQPFHTDRRVNLYTYSSGAVSSTSTGSAAKPWVFGTEIAMKRLHVRSFNQSEDEDIPGQATRPADMENLISLGNSNNNTEEVVITTRRKKRQTETSPGQFTRTEEDGFFEDDCDVLDFARDRV